jgi:hypothetical protein
MFCGDFCNAWAFYSHVWSPFRGCGASERLSACGADFMNPKNHMHTQRWFCMAICMKAQWRGLWLELFFWLSSYSDCACDAAFQGRSPCTQKIMHMPSEVSDTFCWSPCPYLARLKDSMPWEHSMRFRYFSREFKAPKNQVRSNSAFHASISAQWHLERCKPACPHFFPPSQCSSLDLSRQELL